MQSTHLRITALASGETTARIRLPNGLQYCRPQDLLWLPDSRAVIVRFGKAWALDAVQRCAWEVDPAAPAGLVFADLPAGSRERVKLPCQRRLVRAGHPLQCAVARSGNLVVMHADALEELSLSVYSASGSLLASTSDPQLGVLRPQHPNLKVSFLSWSPSSLVVAFHLMGNDADESTGLCLWHPFDSGPPQRTELLCGLAPDGSGLLAWSPCSRMLLVQFDDGTCTIFDPVSCTVTQRAPGEQNLCSSWGFGGVTSLTNLWQHLTRLRSRLIVSRALCWCTVQGTSFQPPLLKVDFGSRAAELSAPVCSPDGLHCALVTWSFPHATVEQRCLIDPRLEVFSRRTGRCIQHPLGIAPADRRCIVSYCGIFNFDFDLAGQQRPMADPTWASYRLRWAADSSALLCSFSSGEEHLLLTFV